MSLFVARVSAAGLSGAVSATLLADPSTAGDPARVAEAVAAVEASGKATFRWSRIAVSVLVAAALIAVGAGLVWLGDHLRPAHGPVVVCGLDRQGELDWVGPGPWERAVPLDPDREPRRMGPGRVASVASLAPRR
jgi:hypothetical protein